MTNYQITFMNDSYLPVALETWQQNINGLETLETIYVKIGETVSMSSLTGEWCINNQIWDKDLHEDWVIAGYKSDLIIGKISDTPCIRGEYCWIYCEDFKMEYINGKFVLSKFVMNLEKYSNA